MSRYLITCLPEEDLSNGSHQTPSQVPSSPTEVGAIKSCLSSPIVLSSKVSRKVQPVHPNSPESEPASQYTLLKRSYYQALRKLGILPQISAFPSSNIQVFLTSIPDSLGLKIVPRRYTKHSVESLLVHLKISPVESNPDFPRKVESSPQQ